MKNQNKFKMTKSSLVSRLFIDAGVTCVGMGSKLISKEILESKDYVKLEKDVATTLALINTIR